MLLVMVEAQARSEDADDGTPMLMPLIASSSSRRDGGADSISNSRPVRCRRRYSAFLFVARMDVLRPSIHETIHVRNSKNASPCSGSWEQEEPLDV